MTSKNPKRLFIFAGEHSGDLHGSHLLKALKPRLPGCSVTGVGGPGIRGQGIEQILGVEDFEVMGFTDVLKCLPKLCRQFYTVRNHILEVNPDAAVLIDYPGFNLRMAKALRKKGYKGKIVQYISPTIWAWGKGRANLMARHLDLLLTIYPFEAESFAGTGLKVKYVGNPLQEYIRNHTYQNYWLKEVGIPSSAPIIALFPGSREGEINRNLPIQLEAAGMLSGSTPCRTFAISCADQHCAKLIEKLILQSKLTKGKDVFLVPKRYTYELMRDSRTAVAKSGTVTLELALHQRPTVVIYRLTSLNRFIAKRFMGLNLPHYCIVNILRGASVFPELIEHGLTAQNLADHLQKLDEEGTPRSRTLDGCRRAAALLQDNDASLNAARCIEEIL